jgi:hypothetical protein
MRAIQRLWTVGGSKPRTSAAYAEETGAYDGIDVNSGSNDVAATKGYFVPVSNWLICNARAGRARTTSMSGESCNYFHQEKSEPKRFRASATGRSCNSDIHKNCG